MVKNLVYYNVSGFYTKTLVRAFQLLLTLVCVCHYFLNTLSKLYVKLTMYFLSKFKDIIILKFLSTIYVGAQNWFLLIFRVSYFIVPTSNYANKHIVVLALLKSCVLQYFSNSGGDCFFYLAIIRVGGL